MFGPDEPGIRSRIAPKVRVPLVPMEWTPLTSRQDIPAIFCTTDCATLILPSAVFSRSRARSGELLVGAALVDPVAVPVAVDAWVIVYSLCLGAAVRPAPDSDGEFVRDRRAGGQHTVSRTSDHEMAA